MQPEAAKATATAPTPATRSPQLVGSKIGSVPRDREGQFHTQAFERYNRDVPHIADGLMQMFVAGVSTHKVGEVAETRTDAVPQQIAATFGCAVGNYYGSSEAVGLTYECRHHQLHVDSDWYILEPVDEHDQPVPPGQLSHAVLVTNLANRV